MAIKFLSGQTISGTLTVSGNVQGATFNGLAINTTGTNNVANQIVRTQSNGYVNFGWINSVSGNHTGSITRITASNDAYLRYVTPAQFRTGVTDGFYAPSSTVSGVTSVATGNGLTGGTITTTGTLTMSGDYTGIFTVHEGRVWDPTTQGVSKGSIHIDPDEGTDHAGGAITFGASDASAGNNAQAGIYIRSDGSYGTRMYLATTDSYATGSKTALNIDHSGNVNITRGFLQISNGNLTLAGTGRIQGVDTVSASTDAANKAYVDAHPGSGGTVTSVATGSGLTGGTITTTGTLSVDSTVIRTTGNQSITGNTTFYPSSTSTSYSTAAIELMASSSGASGTPPRIAWHWGGVVASSMTIESNGTIAVRNNPGNDYEQFKASTITATSSMLSPIYYDSANGAYYGDFASTSVFNKLNTGIGNLGTSRSVSYSMTVGNWYRIASGAGRSCGDIYIQDGISGGPHGNLTFYAGSSYSQYAGTMLKLKSSSFYSVIGFTEIRLLIGTTYQDQFVEIYCQRTGTYNITVQDTHSATNQWILSTSATVGSVPTGYSDSTRLDINGMLIAEAGNGSNRFAVDRVGAIHLSGGTSGNSGQVLTSGGTGSPTWTTLQNQTGGPFLPLAGGTISGNLIVTGDTETRGGINLRRDLSSGTGISFYTPSYYNWQIYMASQGATGCGANANLTAPAGLNTVSSWAIRSRMENVSTYGWLWELGGGGGGGATASSIMELGVTGNLQTTGSMRAPIFYDSNDTTYYLDPASTSQVNTMEFVGSTNNGRFFGDTWGVKLQTDAGYILFGPANTSHAHIYTDRSNFYFNQQIQLNGGSLINTNDIRAQIFYDLNNTGYYVDPASTSNLSKAIFNTSSSGLPRQITIKEDGDTENSMGSYPGAWTSALNIQSNDASTYLWFSPLTSNIPRIQTNYGQLDFYTGNNTGRALHLSGTSARSEIFYDLQNTAYYGDFAGTSNLNGLTVAGTITGSIETANKLAITGYQTNGQSFYQTSGSFAGFSGWHNYYIGNHGNGSNYYNTTIAFPFWGPPRYSRLEGGTSRGPYNFLTNENDQTIGVYLQSTTSLRAPIFYDYNNTAFYLDPSTTGTSVNVAGDVVAYASSDIRFKNNITPITNALDKLSKIGGYTFEWNEISHKETGKKDIGVVAQEVEEILPEIVQTRSNGYKAVDYQKLTALLIESVKEQQVIINDLKTRIETLENN